MGAPTDIPGFPPGGSSSGSSNGIGRDGSDGLDGDGLDGDGGVRNELVRMAVEAFAAEPGQQTMVDVLRHCLFGPLLLDVTGSQIDLDENGEIGEGSTIEVHGGEGPDGNPAMFAFTSHAEIERMYDDGAQTQSLVQEAADVLEMCRSQDAAWLFLDPAGPTCAVSADDIGFALQVPRNDVVRAALQPGTSKQDLLAALNEEGPLSLAVESSDDALPAGNVPGDTELRVRATDAPDGSGQALVAFTSGPEVVARASDVQIATQSAVDVLSVVRDSGFAGLVLNPAGPWAYLTRADIEAYQP